MISKDMQRRPMQGKGNSNVAALDTQGKTEAGQDGARAGHQKHGGTEFPARSTRQLKVLLP